MYRYSIASIILSIIFISTNRTLSYEDALLNGITDIKSYYYIANNTIDNSSSQSFEAFGLDEDGNPGKPSAHHLERWPIHKLIGLISNSLELDLMITYRIAIVLLITACTLIINSLKCNDVSKIAAFSIILFNPYTFRSCYAAGDVSHGAFLIALLLITCGIVNKSHFQIIAGSACAIILRQTGILLIPIYLVLFYSKYISKRIMILSSLVILIGFMLIKLLTIQFYNSLVSINTFFYIEHLLGIIPWLINEPKLTEAISFFGRYIFFLLTLGCLALCFNQFMSRKLIFVFSGIFLFAHLQPLGAGPLVTGGNIQRLSSLGLPFLIPIVINSNMERKIIAFFVLICIMVSFHHNTSILSYIKHSEIIFLLLVVLSFISSFYIRYSFKNANKKLNN